MLVLYIFFMQLYVKKILCLVNAKKSSSISSVVLSVSAHYWFIASQRYSF